MAKKKEKFYMVNWHDRDSNLSGSDLVHASSKKEARQIYRGEHYSPIDEIIEEGVDDLMKWMFEDITKKERNQAKKTGIINIESGT